MHCQNTPRRCHLHNSPYFFCQLYSWVWLLIVEYCTTCQSQFAHSLSKTLYTNMMLSLVQEVSPSKAPGTRKTSAFCSSKTSLHLQWSLAWEGTSNGTYLAQVAARKPPEPASSPLQTSSNSAIDSKQVTINWITECSLWCEDWIQNKRKQVRGELRVHHCDFKGEHTSHT